MATYGEIKIKPARRQPGIITAFDLDGNTYAVRYYLSNVPANAATEVGTPVLFEDVYYPNGWGVDGEFRLTTKREIQRAAPRAVVRVHHAGKSWRLGEPNNTISLVRNQPEFDICTLADGLVLATIPAYMWRGDDVPSAGDLVERQPLKLW